jgi:hypothetical protein
MCLFSSRPVDHNDTENVYETLCVTLCGKEKPLSQTRRTTLVRDDKDKKTCLLQRAIWKHCCVWIPLAAYYCVVSADFLHISCCIWPLGIEFKQPPRSIYTVLSFSILNLPSCIINEFSSPQLAYFSLAQSLLRTPCQTGIWAESTLHNLMHFGFRNEIWEPDAKHTTVYADFFNWFKNYFTLPFSLYVSVPGLFLGIESRVDVDGEESGWLY